MEDNTFYRKILESTFIKTLPKKIFFNMIWACIFLVLFHIPLINIPLVILSIPLSEIFPELGKTGKHIEYTFFIIFVKTKWAAAMYILYFFCIIFFGGIVLSFITKNNKRFFITMLIILATISIAGLSLMNHNNAL